MPKETPIYNNYSIFLIQKPMMIPNSDPNQEQASMFYMVPIPVDPTQIPKDY